MPLHTFSTPPEAATTREARSRSIVTSQASSAGPGGGALFVTLNITHKQNHTTLSRSHLDHTQRKYSAHARICASLSLCPTRPALCLTRVVPTYNVQGATVRPARLDRSTAQLASLAALHAHARSAPPSSNGRAGVCSHLKTGKRGPGGLSGRSTSSWAAASSSASPLAPRPRAPRPRRLRRRRWRACWRRP